MSKDRKKLERNVLEQTLPIPDLTETKIQATYDIVRAKSRENKKVQPIRRHSLRHVWAAGLAAALIAVSGLGVAASMGYFSKGVSEEEGNVSYNFEINYELKPVEVEAEPEYLPAGMKDQGGGKYSSDEEYGHGISIIPMNMVNIDQEKERMNFKNVENVEKTTIQNMEAHIITYEDAEKYRSGKDLFLFNPEEGYVIRIFGDYNIPVGEVKKVAEGLKITVTENEDLKYGMSPEEQEKQDAWEAGEEEWQRLVDKGVTSDQITRLGEALDCEGYGCKYTVKEVKLYDSLYDIPGYTEQGVYDIEQLKPWLNADGTHKPYQRMHLDENGEIIEEDTAAPKFLVVKATAEQYAAYDGADSTALDASLVYAEKRSDGTWNYRKDTFEAVPSEEYELQMDNSCFYLDQPENLTGDARSHSFFFRVMEKGESIDYTLIFAVDGDQVSGDGLNNILLRFNGTGNDDSNPMWSALGEIK